MKLLVLSETSAVVLPLAYLVCFLTAYHGPNAEVLGNVKSSHWQYMAVEDAWKTSRLLLMLVAIDGLSLVISFLVLRFSFGVNLVDVFLHIQKEYGLVMAFQHGFFLDHCFCQLVVACSSDFTFQLSWLFEDDDTMQTINGTMSMLENATVA